MKGRLAWGRREFGGLSGRSFQRSVFRTQAHGLRTREWICVKARRDVRGLDGFSIENLVLDVK